MDIQTYAVIKDGLVANTISWDGNMDPETGGIVPPADEVWAAVLDGQTPNIGLAATLGDDGTWTYASPAAPVVTPEQILSANKAMRQALLDIAADEIAPLQDAVDLGTIEPAEQALLTKWKTFRVAVNRIDLTAANPAWPQAPNAAS